MRLAVFADPCINGDERHIHFECLPDDLASVLVGPLMPEEDRMVNDNTER